MAKENVLSVSLIKEAEGGYSAVCTELDIASQGETIEEALSNVKEAVELYIESASDIGILEQLKEKLGIEELKDGLLKETNRVAAAKKFQDDLRQKIGHWRGAEEIKKWRMRHS